MSTVKMRYGGPKANAAGATTPNAIGAFDLGTGTLLTAGMDLDDIKGPGCWYSPDDTVSTGVSHSPITSVGYKLIVMRFDPGWVVQVAIARRYTCDVYLRRWGGSTWSTWVTLNHS